MGNARTILERPAGQANFTPVNVVVPAGARIEGFEFPGPVFAVDSAGDMFAIGAFQTTATNKQGTVYYVEHRALFEMAAGQSSFTPVYSTTTGFYASGITIVGSGPSAGIYVIEATNWKVDKSTDGGASWTTVSSYNYDPNVAVGTYTFEVASDSTGSGNVFVVGSGEQQVITGYKTVKVKGQWIQQPIYGYQYHWLTRQSSDGGQTWTTADDFQLSPTPGQMNQAECVADVAGTVYVGGRSVDSSGLQHSIMRTNAGGAWSTADDDANGSEYDTVTIDPTTGTPYASTGFQSSWTIRSGPAAALSSSIASAASTAFSSTLLTTSDTIGSDRATSWLKSPEDSRLPDIARNNIDWDATGQDLRLGGDIFTLVVDRKVHDFDASL